MKAIISQLAEADISQIGTLIKMTSLTSLLLITMTS